MNGGGYTPEELEKKEQKRKIIDLIITLASIAVAFIVAAIISIFR